MKKILSVLLILLVLSGVIILGFNHDKNQKLEKQPIEKPEVETPESKDRIESITMLSVGDIMFHDSQLEENINHPSGYFFEDSLALMKPYFQEADITIGNFESTSTPSQNYRGYPTFNTPVEAIDAIKDAGFDILSTINNHTLDSGKQGVIDTYNSIEERGMIPMGTKVSPDIESLKTIEKEGIKLGFLAYTYGFNGLDSYLSPEEHEYMVSFMDEEIMEKEIKSSVEADNDLTVVMIHWGNEYQTTPTEAQEVLAKKMVDWGADIILGSHPHVVQEAEMFEDAFVIYSMGNFISNQRLETLDDIDTERGLMIEFTIEKNFETNVTTVKEIDYHPLWVNKYLIDGKNFHQVIPTKDFLDGKIEASVTEDGKERIQSAYDGTMKRIKGQH